jgi:hypothetical protein
VTRNQGDWLLLDSLTRELGQPATFESADPALNFIVRKQTPSKPAIIAEMVESALQKA